MKVIDYYDQGWRTAIRLNDIGKRRGKLRVRILTFAAGGIDVKNIAADTISPRRCLYRQEQYPVARALRLHYKKHLTGLPRGHRARKAVAEVQAFIKSGGAS